MNGVFHVVFGYMFHVSDYVFMCYKFRGKTYTRYDVYWKCDCVVMTWKKRRWNTKVRNYNLRGLENGMN